MNDKTKLKLPPPAQIAIVVKDREKTRAFYSSTFGIGPWRLAELEYPDIMVRGRKSAYRVGLAMAQWGEADLCLVQPLSGHSLYSEFLEEGKEGFHHLAFDLTKEEKERALADLKEEGIEVLQGAVSSLGTGASWAYLSTDKIGGAFFEIRYRPSKIPPPIYRPAPPCAGPEPKVKLPFPSQMSSVVKDLDKTKEFYSATFGIGPWRVMEMDYPEIMVRGRKSSCKLRTAAADLGGIDLELVQPLSGISLYAEFLDQGREGLHHLTFDFTREGMEQAIADLKEEGIEVIQGVMNASGTGDRFAYLNTDKIGGTIFKLRHGPRNRAA
jgi:methylmalonyl-CoA/ethylmalonyl-CoA epimerase